MSDIEITFDHLVEIGKQAGWDVLLKILQEQHREISERAAKTPENKHLAVIADAQQKTIEQLINYRSEHGL